MTIREFLRLSTTVCKEKKQKVVLIPCFLLIIVQKLCINTNSAYSIKRNAYRIVILWLGDIRLGRSKLKVRMGFIFKKMVESYENSLKTK